MLVFASSSLAQTNGTIPVGTSLTATQNSTPWLSPSADFAFGFQFRPQNGLFLLSIWYHNLPEKTIVWHANKGNLVPSGSKLELNAQNGLVLTDPQGNQLWSTTIPSTIDHGFINNTGNFVLLGSDSSISWQSFENPTDTLLPTQTMEINGVLNSRISNTNFSQGRFQFRMLEDGNAVLNPRDVLSNFPYEAYFRSDTYDGSNSSNSGRRLVFSDTGHMFVVRRNGQITDLPDQAVTRSPDNYYRATLNFDGVLVIYSHPKRSNGEQNWTAIWTKPDNICLNIFASIGSGACGYNSICKLDNNRRPFCKCPLGYSLQDPNDKYGSCKPSFVQSCDENGPNLGKDLYSLKELSNTNWPMNDYERNYPISEEGCRNSCLNDCFCAVAIYNPGSGCWKKKLPLSNGQSDATILGKVFLKFKKGGFPEKGPDSSDPIPGSRKKQGTLILTGSLLFGSSVFINFVLLSVVYFHVYKKKINRPIVGNNNMVETNLRAFSYEELVQATNGFKDELGRGAFSLVYKGVIDIDGSGNNVAIKKLDRVVEDGEKEFRAELNYLSVGAREREILTDWVWDCFQEGKLEALVEDDVEALNNMMILERFVMVGIWCIQEDPFLRPSMRKVSQMLEGVVEVIPPPCPFPFSTITMGSEQ
ncbi:hypothetical protein LguiB_001583 [Lonicera macranthoides]